MITTSSPAHPPPRPSLRSDARVIGLVGLAHGVSHFYHLILAALFVWLKPAFNLSYAELGLLMTVFFIISGVGQALAGFVVDRFGARAVLFPAFFLLACRRWPVRRPQLHGPDCWRHAGRRWATRLLPAESPTAHTRAETAKAAQG